MYIPKNEVRTCIITFIIYTYFIIIYKYKRDNGEGRTVDFLKNIYYFLQLTYHIPYYITAYVSFVIELLRYEEIV